MPTGDQWPMRSGRKKEVRSNRQYLVCNRQRPARNRQYVLAAAWVPLRYRRSRAPPAQNNDQHQHRSFLCSCAPTAWPLPWGSTCG